MFFHALTFAGSRGCCLNRIDRVIKHLPRDRVSANAIKENLCDRYSCIIILPYSNPIRTEKAAETLNCPFSGFL